MAENVRDDRRIDRFVNICEVCGSDASLKVCARCKKVAYCSKEHQKQAWTLHKKKCKKFDMLVAKTSESNRDSSSETPMGAIRNKLSTLSIGSKEVSSAVTSQKQRVMHQLNCDVNSKFDCSFKINLDTCGSSGRSNNESHREEPRDVSKNNTKNEVGSVFGGPTSNLYKDFSADFSESDDGALELTESGSSERFILETEDSEIHAPDYSDHQGTESFSQSAAKMPYFSVIEARNKALGDYVTKCLNAYGLCVIDNFLGDSKGTDILDEVVDMYEHGELTSGQLVNTNSPKGAVRGDIITWIDGTELGCSNVSFLISSIDAIMLHCQRSLGHYQIKGRSKAMVAAYPGKSTGFLRHVDNPSGDGRCVTCIYYLNKSWNSKVDGGLLRIFPEGTNRVANVEPKFDRLLFFWSDRRNPHEVLPAYRMRYAVTVWYYDEQERKRAVKRFKGSTDVVSGQDHIFPLNSVVGSTS